MKSNLDNQVYSNLDNINNLILRKEGSKSPLDASALEETPFLFLILEVRLSDISPLNYG